MTDPQGIRIAKFLAGAGVASRRKSEELVSAGRIALNGEVITDLGRRIDPERDRVALDGEPVRVPQRELTLVHNKPVGVLVTRDDPGGRPTVYDNLPEEFRAESPRLRYAGRLDYMTSGLLILSTDGDLVNRLTHPRRHVEKEYAVVSGRELTAAEIERLRKGTELGRGETSLPAIIVPRGPGRSGFRYRVVLTEGRNRQIRRMFESVGAQVTKLRRTRIGRLELGDLAEGGWRVLGAKERALLLNGPETGGKGD